MTKTITKKIGYINLINDLEFEDDMLQIYKIKKEAEFWRNKPRKTIKVRIEIAK